MKRSPVLFFVVVLLAGPAGAELPAEEPARARGVSETAPTHVVAITAAGSAESLALVEGRARALLRDYPVIVEWSVRASFRPRDVFETDRVAGGAAAESSAALTRIWLDLRDPARAVLYVVDVAHERFLVRVVPLESGYDEVAGESLGTILQSSVDVLLAGATLGVTREAAEEQVSALEAPEPAPAAPQAKEPPARAPAPPLHADRPPPYRIALEAAYRAQVLSGGPELLQGPDVGVSLLRPAARIAWGGFLDVGYRAPLDWQEGGVGAHFQGVGMRGGTGVRFGLGRTVSMALLGSVGVDGLEVTPVVNDATTESTSPFWIAAPMVGLQLEGDVQLGRGVSLWCSLGAEVDLMGHHFDVLQDGEPVVVLAPWRVQPLLRLGLRFSP